MKLSGEHLRRAPREEIWVAMNNAAVAHVKISGCKALEKLQIPPLRARDRRRSRGMM